MYALTQEGSLYKYPYSVTDLRRNNPNVSFPPQPDDAVLATFGMVPVRFTTPPVIDPSTHKNIEGPPVFNVDHWEQTWQVVALSAEEIQEQQQALQDSIVDQTQQRLDNFAKSRNYAGILSACTYATSPTAKFAIEGQDCVTIRDATWSKLYSMLDEVKAGTRPMPESYAAIEAELPALVWTNNR